MAVTDRGKLHVDLSRDPHPADLSLLHRNSDEIADNLPITLLPLLSGNVSAGPYVLAQTLDPALPTCLRLSPPALTGSHLLIKRHEQVAEADGGNGAAQQLRGDRKPGMFLLPERIQGNDRNLFIPGLFQTLYDGIVDIAGAAGPSCLRFHERDPLRLKPS